MNPASEEYSGSSRPESPINMNPSVSSKPSTDQLPTTPPLGDGTTSAKTTLTPSSSKVSKWIAVLSALILVAALTLNFVCGSSQKVSSPIVSLDSVIKVDSARSHLSTLEIYLPSKNKHSLNKYSLSTGSLSVDSALRKQQPALIALTDSTPNDSVTSAQPVEVQNNRSNIDSTEFYAVKSDLSMITDSFTVSGGGHLTSGDSIYATVYFPAKEFTFESFATSLSNRLGSQPSNVLRSLLEKIEKPFEVHGKGYVETSTKALLGFGIGAEISALKRIRLLAEAGLTLFPLSVQRKIRLEYLF